MQSSYYELPGSRFFLKNDAYLVSDSLLRISLLIQMHSITKSWKLIKLKHSKSINSLQQMLLDGQRSWELLLHGFGKSITHLQRLLSQRTV